MTTLTNAIVEILVSQLREAPDNPNGTNDFMKMHLLEAFKQFGNLGVLLVRDLLNGTYEVLSGNQRLAAMRELGIEVASCIVVDCSFAESRLLMQAMNHIHGEDDLGLRAELLKGLIGSMGEADILKILPETSEGLRSLSSLGQEDLASYLENWQTAQSARLKHLQVQLTRNQLEVVEEALNKVMPLARNQNDDSPNVRGTALYFVCKGYLENAGANQ